MFLLLIDCRCELMREVNRVRCPKCRLGRLHNAYNACRPAVLAILSASLCLLGSCRSTSPPQTPQGWFQLTGPGPTARWTHAAVFDPARRTAVVFGGFGVGNEVWIFSFDSLSWTRADAPNGHRHAARIAALFSTTQTNHQERECDHRMHVRLEVTRQQGACESEATQV
jgi:hypothetical protein